MAPMHRARRRFGQNFLVDRGVVASLIDAISPQADDRVVEIGPGLGALTEPLLARLETLDVVEIDRDLVAALAQRFPAERLRIHQADALTFDFCALGPTCEWSAICLTTSLRRCCSIWRSQAGCVRDCHFMLQREVVDRIVAVPGSKVYGRLSVMLQYRFHAERVLRVSAGAFRPVPEVESAFLRLVPQRPLPFPGARREGVRYRGGEIVRTAAQDLAQRAARSDRGRRARGAGRGSRQARGDAAGRDVRADRRSSGGYLPRWMNSIL